MRFRELTEVVPRFPPLYKGGTGNLLGPFLASILGLLSRHLAYQGAGRPLGRLFAQEAP
jgi:hypothetical protein